MCEIALALHERENIHCMLVCTLEVDNIQFLTENTNIHLYVWLTLINMATIKVTKTVSLLTCIFKCLCIHNKWNARVVQFTCHLWQSQQLLHINFSCSCSQTCEILKMLDMSYKICTHMSFAHMLQV